MSRAEAAVAVFCDEAVELSRILEVFLELAARGGDRAIAELSDIAYGDRIPGYLAWTGESLQWVADMAVRLKQQAAAVCSDTNGEQR